MSATVKYKGNTIASLSNGQTVTLKCAGKVMEGSVEISISGNSPPDGGEVELAPEYDGSLMITDSDGTETEGSVFDGAIRIFDI